MPKDKTKHHKIDKPKKDKPKKERPKKDKKSSIILFTRLWLFIIQ